MMWVSQMVRVVIWMEVGSDVALYGGVLLSVQVVSRRVFGWEVECG